MKKLFTLVLVLIFCTAAFAETETETVQTPELMDYIGKPFGELMVRLGEPADEVQAFKEGRYQKYNFEDGYTVYLKDDTITVRANNEDYRDYGWDPDTVFYIGLSSNEYTLFGHSVGALFPDVDSLLQADGWNKMAEPILYTMVSYEKNIGDIKYMLGFIYSDHDFEEDYNHVRYIVLQGIRPENAN